MIDPSILKCRIKCLLVFFVRLQFLKNPGHGLPHFHFVGDRDYGKKIQMACGPVPSKLTKVGHVGYGRGVPCSLLVVNSMAELVSVVGERIALLMTKST